MADVDPESPAGRAGIRRADVLIALDGQRLLSPVQFQNRIFRRPAGEKLHLSVLRGKTELETYPVVRDRKDQNSLLARLAHPEKNLIARLGVLCIEIDKDVAAMIPGLRREYGLIVAAKSPGGQSQFVDLQPGGYHRCGKHFSHAVPRLPAVHARRHETCDPVVLQIERDGRFQYLAFELDR